MRRNFHGRRHGKALRPRQRRLVEELLPLLAIPGLDACAAERVQLDLAAMFPGSSGVWLEIGTGGGEHLTAQAALHPQVAMIGCEIYVNGLAMMLGRIEAQRLGNIRIHPGDARDLIDVVPDGALGRVFLLYPDPWPKARHHKRRFMNVENLRALARVMAPGAELRLATDITGYVEHALDAVAGLDAFETAPGDPHAPWSDWQPTRYEVKALREGRQPHYLRFLRR